MAAEDDGAQDDKPAGSGRKSRRNRQRQPVTIDLTAERLSDKGEGASGGEEAAAEVGEAAGTPAGAGAPEPDVASGPAADAPAPAEEPAEPPPPEPEPESVREPERPSARANWLPGASIIGSDDGWTRPALAGVAGGIVALILLLVLQAVGLIPSPGQSAARAAADQAKSANEAVAGLDRRVSAVEMITQNLPSKSAVDTLDGQVAQLQKQMGALATQGDLTALENKFAALSSKVDGLSGGGVSQDDFAALTDRVARLEAGGTAGSGGSASEGAVAALNQRIDQAQASIKAIGNRVAALEEKGSGGPSDSTLAARAIAVVALRRAIDEGVPFATDLDLAAALGLPADDIAALKPYADKGVPTKAALAARFADISDAIVSASTKANPDAGWFQRFMAGAGSLVTVRPTGPIAGNDPVAVVSRMRAAVEAGDFAKALDERAGLPPAGKEASAEWAAAAEQRAAIDGLIARIAGSIKPDGGNNPT